MHLSRVFLLFVAAFLALFNLTFAMEMQPSSLLQPCISIQPLNQQSNHTMLDPREDSILLHCLIIQATTAFIRVGNYSVPQNIISCSPTVAYSYSFDPPKTLPVQGAVSECVFGGRDNSVSFCAFAKSEGNVVHFSAAVSQPDLDKFKKLPFLSTTVNFDFNGLLRAFAFRAATAFSKSVTDPGELRRRVFTGSAKYPLCPFFPATDPPCRLM
ncbi:hypothetical protein BWQ96_02593 [Gracilariopsis chorda]|uniref:Uncharacterized protein n=1 Tax=Gracilariopsis chorda TaxID=448386 RepID=A0A2V3IZP0_9FLOR|nr:hypothetical protein BWQ96_02593 [Gracilariopsis chorda]|eukprot:PXF47614.1 hypothetical protein BWQ96_02593 [Gracilariopsis chorda]